MLWETREERDMFKLFRRKSRVVSEHSDTFTLLHGTAVIVTRKLSDGTFTTTTTGTATVLDAAQVSHFIEQATRLHADTSDNLRRQALKVQS